jgi:alkylation response protein AidB-like acyl-CoA dehydrogenase
MSSILFDDVMLDDDAILARGAEAQTAVQQTLAWLQALDCARMYGAVRALYEKTLDYAKTRKQFSVHIGSFQVIQHYLVDMFIDLQQLESMLLMASIKATSRDAMTRDRACAAAKAYFSDRAVRIAQQAIQIHGGIGVTEELDVGHYFRLITHCSLSHGARDIQIERFAALSEAGRG